VSLADDFEDTRDPEARAFARALRAALAPEPIRPAHAERDDAERRAWEHEQIERWTPDRKEKPKQ
jgi:hypothetical protein